MKKSYETPWLTSVKYLMDNVLSTSGLGYVDGDDTIIDYDKIGIKGLRL